MKLYDLKAGLNPRRVRIFLAEKGVPIEKVDIDLMSGENRDESFLAKNPMGTLPVLELDDGAYLSESIAICRYFEELHPEPPLFGSSLLERAHIEMWNRRMELEIQLPIQDVFHNLSPVWATRRQQVAEYGRMRHAQLFERMAWLNRELAGRAYIAGERYTVADITAQCAFVLGAAASVHIPGDMIHLRRWFDVVVRRPSARA